MSLTPTIGYNGENTCRGCDKPMYANERGIVFNPRKGEDMMFCTACATQLAVAISQDLGALNPDLGFSTAYQDMSRPRDTMYRHAGALHELAQEMREYADMLGELSANSGAS